MEEEQEVVEEEEKQKEKQEEEEEVTNALVPNASYDVAAHPQPERERKSRQYKSQRNTFPPTIQDNNQMLPSNTMTEK